MHIGAYTRRQILRATTEADVASIETQMHRLRLRVHQAARLENSHGKMV